MLELVLASQLGRVGLSLGDGVENTCHLRIRV